MTTTLDLSSRFLNQVRGQLIVSCLALPDEPLHGSDIMAKMALAAWQGGAVGICGNSPQDIRAIRQTVPLPIIGLYKNGNEGVNITPTFEHARVIAEAGADIIALDATPRPRPDKVSLAKLIDRIHKELGKPVLAEVATLEEAIQAEKLGAEMVTPTLTGKTLYSPQRGDPLPLLAQMVQAVKIPVLAGGGFNTPDCAKQAIQAGAWAVIVGSAITRPQVITAWFAQALRG